MITRDAIAGIVLAGGKASRMQYRDKALLPLHGHSLIERVVTLASPQVNELLISVNRQPEKYAFLHLPLIPDHEQPFAGPLLGIDSGMRWLAANRNGRYTHLACFAADVPRFPETLVSTLAAQLEQSAAQLAVCVCDDQIQPLFSLWSLECQPVIADAIADGLYGPKLVLPGLSSVEVTIERQHAADFYNVNSEENLTALTDVLHPT
jgi:molybdopterin-guanine dinucleotide biosynthesis protein A